MRSRQYLLERAALPFLPDKAGAAGTTTCLLPHAQKHVSDNLLKRPALACSAKEELTEPNRSQRCHQHSDACLQAAKSRRAGAGECAGPTASGVAGRRPQRHAACSTEIRRRHPCAGLRQQRKANAQGCSPVTARRCGPSPRVSANQAGCAFRYLPADLRTASVVLHLCASTAGSGIHSCQRWAKFPPWQRAPRACNPSTN